MSLKCAEVVCSCCYEWFVFPCRMLRVSFSLTGIEVLDWRIKNSKAEKFTFNILPNRRMSENSSGNSWVVSIACFTWWYFLSFFRTIASRQGILKLFSSWKYCSFVGNVPYFVFLFIGFLESWPWCLLNSSVTECKIEVNNWLEVFDTIAITAVWIL